MMGEALTAHIPPTDVMHPDWDTLLAPFELVPTPPPPTKHAAKNVSKRLPKVVEISQPVSQAEGKSICLWCGKRFHGRSNKRFCTPETERGLNFKRRQALITAVAEQFKQWKWSTTTGTLQNVAKKCVDAEYELFLKRMPVLGWKYNEKTCQWAKV